MAKAKHADSAQVLASMADIIKRFDRAKLSIFVSELLTWNQRLGLISKRDPARLVSRLIRQSVSLWDFIEKTCSSHDRLEGLRVVDIGSGGGFPGMIWKMMRSNLNVTLVERKERKAVFLERIAHLLDFDGLEVAARDAREIAGESGYREAFDLAVMLAVAPAERNADLIEALLKPSGWFCTVRGGEEKVFPDTLGDNMRIHSAAAAEEGVFLLYEKKIRSSERHREQKQKRPQQ